jgi:hypothetical protein
VKSSAGAVGPGPNVFSDSASNVWVDGSGRLHLKLTYSKGRWRCAEVINTQSLGRGRYTFELDSPNDGSGHLRRATQPAATSSTHSFDWQPGSVAFVSSTAAPW